MLKKKHLTKTDFHLPYNCDLVTTAKEHRKTMTAGERKLWHEYLKYFQFRVLRQRPINHFIVDFYCAALKLVIEIDGDSHFTEQGKVYDCHRTEVLQGYGLRVIRFTNEEVLKDFKGVCQTIENLIPPTPLKKGGN